jgi:hypothetical protein
MRTIIHGLYYQGQPVYEEYNAETQIVRFFSREIKFLEDGTFKFVRWVPLREHKVNSTPERTTVRKGLLKISGIQAA